MTLREKGHDRAPAAVRDARLVATFESDIVDVTVRGRLLRVAVRRAEGARGVRTPLLLMNGIGAALDVLDPLVERLPPDLEVIRFDVPGIGCSPAPVLPYTYAALASRVGALLRTLGYDRVDVLGYSWGGGLAQQFAVSHPRWCRLLVLAATGAGAAMVPGRPRVLARMPDTATPPRRCVHSLDRGRALRRQCARQPGSRGAGTARA